MHLNYFKSKNFGDALNPYIFEKFLPDFFDDDPKEGFVGIGSILGLEHTLKLEKKIVFSSGFAYGRIPKIDKSYTVLCVRGPLTAKKLGIDVKDAVTDGAALLKFIEEKPEPTKKYEFSFMPHWESSLKFDWKVLCEEMGVNYLDPLSDSIENTIAGIRASKVVIAEAMHAAIVADTLRVPWIPVKAYGGINDFKWNDWLKTIDLEYHPFQIGSLFDDTEFTREVIKEKTGYPFHQKSLSAVVQGYKLYQSAVKKKKVMKQFSQVMRLKTVLSTDSSLNLVADRLLDKLLLFKDEFSVRNR